MSEIFKTYYENPFDTLNKVVFPSVYQDSYLMTSKTQLNSSAYLGNKIINKFNLGNNTISNLYLGNKPIGNEIVIVDNKIQYRLSLWPDIQYIHSITTSNDGANATTKIVFKCRTYIGFTIAAKDVSPDKQERKIIITDEVGWHMDLECKDTTPSGLPRNLKFYTKRVEDLLSVTSSFSFKLKIDGVNTPSHTFIIGSHKGVPEFDIVQLKSDKNPTLVKVLHQCKYVYHNYRYADGIGDVITPPQCQIIMLINKEFLLKNGACIAVRLNNSSKSVRVKYSVSKDLSYSNAILESQLNLEFNNQMSDGKLFHFTIDGTNIDMQKDQYKRYHLAFKTYENDDVAESVVHHIIVEPV